MAALLAAGILSALIVPQFVLLVALGARRDGVTPWQLTFWTGSQ